MARLILLAIAVISNALLVLVAIAPGFVTYAELPPSGVACATCTTAEAQLALVRAAAVGRAQVQSLVRPNSWLLFAIALLNVAVVGVLVWMSRSNRTIERDARKTRARPSS